MPAPSTEDVSARAISTKEKTGILLFILCCLLSTVRILVDTPNPAHILPDDVSKRSNQRFAVLKTFLPDHGIIGYLGDANPSAKPDYYLAQYALAPLVVDPSSNHTIVIGNFPSSPPAEIPPNLQLLQDFGNGVLLFAGKDAR